MAKVKKKRWGKKVIPVEQTQKEFEDYIGERREKDE